MKTKFKENHKNISPKGFRSACHSYYFHSDEDFREDRRRPTGEKTAVLNYSLNQMQKLR